MNNDDFPRSSRDINTTNERPLFLEQTDHSFIKQNEFPGTEDEVDIISEDVIGEDQQQISTKQDVKGTSHSMVPEMEPGQNIIGPTRREQKESTSDQWKKQQGQFDAIPKMHHPNGSEQILSANGEETGFHVLLDDFALFESSSIGVYEFSREFLAIVRRHRLQPKARAILLDLLQRIMPENNKCPKTIVEMRKLVACNERAYYDLFRENSSEFVRPVVSDTIRPQLHYLLPQQITSIDNKSFKIKRSHSSDCSSFYHQEKNAFLGREHKMLTGDIYTNAETETAEQSMVHRTDGFHADSQSDLLPLILQTIDRLSQEVALLRMNLSHQSHSGSFHRLNRRSVFSSDERAGIHIVDASDNVVLLSSLTRDELKKTIGVSRCDEKRLIYGNCDVTEIILEKIELSPYLHNASLCGRMVADILFSPDYLSNKHILAEGQTSSRARLELLPSEMTTLFYESLRKLGASRIVEEDREHWLYLARDGVNQRARDIKANRKRKFYTDEHSPVFAERQIE